MVKMITAETLIDDLVEAAMDAANAARRPDNAGRITPCEEREWEHLARVKDDLLAVVRAAERGLILIRVATDQEDDMQCLHSGGPDERRSIK